MGADGFKDDDAENNFLVDVRSQAAKTSAWCATATPSTTIMRWPRRSPSARARLGALPARGTSGVERAAGFWSGDNDANFSTRTALP